MNAAGIAKTLKAKGQPMTLTRSSPGTFDPVTGGISGAIDQTYTVYGITKNYRQDSINSANSLVLGGDKIAVMGASVIEPVPGDRLEIRGVDWVIISVNTLDTAGIALKYDCQVRK